MSRRELDSALDALPGLTSAELRARWGVLTGRAVPQISPSLLRLALAWKLQARVHGGLSRSTSQKLAQFAAGKSVTHALKPGMRLVREWNGRLHIVVIGEDRVVRWDSREWRSLSEVARAITGTRWSGPAFFGLRHKRKAA